MRTREEARATRLERLLGVGIVLAFLALVARPLEALVVSALATVTSSLGGAP